MIGILNAYHFDPKPGNYQENYTPLILDFVKETFSNQPNRLFDIALGKWPKSANECEAWVITGSAKSAYDQDSWILKLQDFVVQLHSQKKKTIGICFGHQIIAQALGGKVEKSPLGWGVGIKDFSVTKTQSWMTPPRTKLALLFSHEDQVTVLPRGATLLAQDSFCANQMVQIGEHILTMQGHPEFSVEFAKARLNSRRDKMPAETFQAAMNSFANPRDGLVIAEWIRSFAL